MSFRTRLIGIAIATLAVAQIACALPGGGASGEPTPTTYVIPTQPDSVEVGSTPELGFAPEDGNVEPADEVPYFNPCNLMTQEEATAALGSPAQPETFGLAAAFGGCSYNSEDFTQSISVTLLTGDDARSLISLAAVLAPMSGTPEVAAQGMAFIERMESMSLGDILTEIRTNPTWQAEDEPDAQPVSGLGDTGFWRWFPEQNKGELEVVQGIHYVMVSVTGKPEAEARPLAEGALQVALTRIPTTPFSTLNVPTPTEMPTLEP